MRRWVRVALLLALSASQASAAAGTSTGIERYVSWRATAARILAQRADAESLAAAAALTFLAHATHAEATAQHAAAVELASRASALAPADAPIAWLRLELCAATLGCDIRDPATAMRWIDADNAAAWLPSLVLAERERNGVEVERILNEMALAQRFDFHWSRTVLRLFDALRSMRTALPAGYVPSDLARYQEATDVADLEVLPPLAPLGAACRGSAERREPCLKVATLMQRGDTVIAQMAGFGIEKRWIAPESREAHALAERRQLLEWRLAAANRAEESILPWRTSGYARRRIAALRTHAREEDVLLVVLRQNRLPLEPAEGSR